MRKLSNRDFQLADYDIKRFIARVPAGTTLKEVMHPEYFNNVINQLIPGRTSVKVISYDNELRADLFLVGVNETTVVWELDHVYSEPGKQNERTDMTEASDFVVSFGGPYHKWRILHNDKIVEKHFESKKLAEARAEALTKARAANM